MFGTKLSFEIQRKPNRAVAINWAQGVTVDDVIAVLDVLKSVSPDVRVLVDGGGTNGSDVRLGDCNIYDDPNGNIVLDAE